MFKLVYYNDGWISLIIRLPLNKRIEWGWEGIRPWFKVYTPSRWDW